MSTAYRKDEGSFTIDVAAVLDERSDAPCALASDHLQLHLAWTGGDHRLNLLATDGVHAGRSVPGHKQTLAHRSYRTDTGGTNTPTSATSVVALAPAVAASEAHGLHVAWTGTDHRLNLGRVALGDKGHLVLPERSGQAPALGAWGPDLVLAWTGTDRRLNVLRTPDGRSGPSWTLEETSSHGPALGARRDELLLAWTGTDRQLNLLRWRGDVPPRGGAGAPEPWTLDARSSHAPALCTLGDDAVLAWTGTDRRVNVLAVRDGAPHGHTVLRATTSHAPALTVHDGRLHLAWTGTDRRLNLAVLTYRR